MPHRLREGLSFCRIGEHFLFLDLQGDRYFRLSVRLERAFLGYAESREGTDAERNELVEQGILVAAPSSEPLLSGDSIRMPSRSAFEHGPRHRPLHPMILLEVLALVCITQLQLKTLALKHVIAKRIESRARRTDGVGNASSDALRTRLLDAAVMFARARRCIPVEPCCLLDSLSLAKFLERRRLSAHLVFGVTIDPFSAHCWVQAEGWILNDTLGNATRHTPIQVI